MASEAEVLGAAHAALSARYQQLVLLNRLSAELFSGKPLAQALADAGPVLLALTGAKAASVHFVDEAGRPYCAHAHADKKLSSPASQKARDAAAAQALETRRESSVGSGPAWVAAPLEADRGRDDDSDGAVALGYHDAVPTDPGREKLLLELGAIVRRARRLERDLERRRQLEKMKTELVALTSHELRTPLAAIQGFAEILLELGDQLPADKRREHLGIILDESKRLSRLVTSYLDLARLEAGGSPPRQEPVSVAALGDKLMALFRDHPSKAALTVTPGPGAETLWADEEQVYRALVNLGGNALRYSPSGGRVEVTSRRVGGGVEVSVTDHGPGMTEDVRARLFEPFYRGDEDRRQKTPGTGLGLAITKAIVEAHGGRAGVESAPGRGARFFFTLPDRS